MNTPVTILVAEDEPTDAFFLRRAFYRAGIAVVLYSFQDGQGIMDDLTGRLQSADDGGPSLPQLILLDMKMPKVDGFAALSWIRKDPRLKHLPVVILSSSDDPRHESRARRLGVDAYFVKPRSIAELTGLVALFKKRWLMGNAACATKAA
jgi:two-component system, response regulator